MVQGTQFLSLGSVLILRCCTARKSHPDRAQEIPHLMVFQRLSERWLVAAPNQCCKESNLSLKWE